MLHEITGAHDRISVHYAWGACHCPVGMIFLSPRKRAHGAAAAFILQTHRGAELSIRDKFGALQQDQSAMGLIPVQANLTYITNM